MIKKRLKQKQRYKHKSQKPNSEIKEKGFLIAFLVFAIIIMIVVFKNPTGNIISNVELDKITFDQNEYLKGDVSLEFQEGDLLPSKTNVVFLIYTNIPKCPHFVCQNNKTVNWYTWNETLDECVLTEPDPEGQCCSRHKDCSQLIVNSGFEKVTGTTPYKWRKTRNVGGTIIEVEADYDVDEETISTVAVIDTEDISKEGYGAFKQDLSAVSFSSPANPNSETQKIISDEEKTLMFDAPSGCIRSNPHIVITPQTQNGNPGDTLIYTITVYNKDSGSDCSDTTFNLLHSPQTFPQHFSLIFGDSSFTLSIGQYKSTTLRVTLKNDAPNGHAESIGIVVNSAEHNWVSTSADFTVGCIRKNPTITITPSAQSGESGDVLHYGVTVKNNDINCGNTNFNLLARPMIEKGLMSFNYDVSSLNIASGQSKSTTLKVTLNKPSSSGGFGMPWDFTVSADSIAHSKVITGATCEIQFSGGEIQRCQVFDSLGDSHSGIRQYKNNKWGECKPYNLKAKIGYEVNIDEGCAFEIILVGSDDQELHYYYQISDVDGCAKPTAGVKETYIDITEDLYITDEGYLNNFSRYIFDDWPGGWDIPANFQFEEIWLKSYGTKIKEDGYEYNYGQVVRWDDVKIIVSETDVSNSCTDRKKKCCTANTGLGEYYELECSEGYECWSSCAPKRTEKLSWFIGKSDSNKKKNMTTEEYSYIKPVEDQLPGELCDEGSDQCYLNYEYGSGYTACSDTSSDSPKKSCRDWDNIYKTEIYSARLKTPKQNGSYNFVFRLEYAPEDKYCGEYEDDEEEIHIYETCLIAEAQVPFTIGDKQIICTPKWEDCENITICNAETNYEEHSVYKCTDSNECGIACNDSITIGLDVCEDWGKTGETCEPEMLPCTADDYDVYDWCDSWTPSPCRPDETQTRTCEDNPEICNATHPDAEAPAIERECTLIIITEYAEEQRASGISKSNVKKELQALGWSDSEIKTVLDDVYGSVEIKWWIWMLLVVVLIAIAAVVFILKTKKPKTKKAVIPQELLSYISDAVASGATKSEIASRLVQAGWPKESVDAAIKSLKIK